MSTYFWIHSGESGITIRPMTSEQVSHHLGLEHSIDILPEHHPVFLTDVPRSEDGHWMKVPDAAVLLIKGDIVTPKPTQMVTQWQIP